jgi:hypothetical protein
VELVLRVRGIEAFRSFIVCQKTALGSGEYTLSFYQHPMNPPPHKVSVEIIGVASIREWRARVFMSVCL